MSYPKVAQLKTVTALRERLATLGCNLPVDDAPLSGAESPLAAPLTIGGRTISNRWCIHPMEGWDANRDGSPTEHTLRRWRHFGLSGAKLIWGGEAAAVLPEGRANPHQTMAIPENRAGLAELLAACRSAHAQECGSTDDLLIGLQLTHSGRFCKPTDKKKFEPRIAHHHPLLDAKFGIDPADSSVVMTDDEIERLIDAMVAGAKLAAEVGYEFVDVKACHGYLLHEFLGARRRPGKFGGELEGRSRLMRTVIQRIRAEIPGLMIGVRLSLFDLAPYATSREVGQPMDFSQLSPDQLPFGASPTNPLEFDLREPLELLQLLANEGVAMFNLSCGSPYYNPHIQRPAIFPPSDGYQPPEDPLVGVWRQIDSVRQVKQALPNLVLVGSGYSYLQDYLPHVAQAVVRAGWVDSVGLGRMVLSYPDLPADMLAGRTVARKKVCRTFSDCTTAPRHGMISGCYPLDDYYKDLPERAELAAVKDALRK